MAEPNDQNKGQGQNPPPAAPETKAKEDDVFAHALVQDAMDAYGIRRAHVLAVKDYGKRVTIVTKGGVKVSYTKGDTVKKLDGAQLDGLPRKKK